MEKKGYPFCALVGQDDMKRALILNMVSPEIGGVLIKGEKGTAKSTAVRALKEVMPPRRERKGCHFHCDPDRPETWCEECRKKGAPDEADITMGMMEVVNLPISATQDRVVGSINIEEMIQSGEKAFEPGLLAKANRNLLYVDEVNLLEDHIVDVLLDAAAMGVNRIEREGISYTHPSRFVLVGTMNPEEGDLRPQLLDRFGLLVTVEGERSLENRMEIMKRRLEYERNPEKFQEMYEKEQEQLGKQITEASRRVPSVSYSDDILQMIAEISIALEVDGHRSDITMLKTAVANAAFSGRDSVSKEDVTMAARFVLPHRMRKSPFEEMDMDFTQVDKILERY